MTLSRKQILFGKDLRKLLDFIESKGYEVVIGEVQRHRVTQEYYVKHGLSKTMNSQHLKKLAADLFISKVGESFDPIYDKEELQQFGDYWESLNHENSWGGNWTSFKDTPHFQREG